MQQGAQNQGSQGRPTLFAPDPRAKADQKPNTLLMGQNQPPSGNAQSTAMAMPGGQQAGSGKERLLMATLYLTDMADYDVVNAVWDAWVPAGTAPSRACVQVVRLAKPGWRVEIAVQAALRD